IKPEPLQQDAAVVIERRKRALHDAEAALRLTCGMSAFFERIDELLLPLDMSALGADFVFGAFELLVDVHPAHRCSPPRMATPARPRRSGMRPIVDQSKSCARRRARARAMRLKKSRM